MTADEHLREAQRILSLASKDGQLLKTARVSADLAVLATAHVELAKALARIEWAA